MDNEFQAVYAHLSSDRPSFLYLGQNYLQLGASTDPLLSSISGKYLLPGKGKPSEIRSFKELLSQCVFEDESAARTWISETCQRLATPQWLEVVAKMPWSGVYSSAIDTHLLKAFRNEWRDVQPIFGKKFFSQDPRSRNNLHVTYLFGGIEREEEDEYAPLSEIGLIRRSTDSTILLSRLSEQVTPFGMLFIEGYRPSSDWLGIREFATVLLALEKKQAHFFSVDEETRRDPLIQHLQKSGNISLYEQSLAAVLNEGLSTGVLSFEVRHDLQKDGHLLSLHDRVIEIPETIWTQVSRSAIIVEDAKLKPPKSMSDEKRYVAFRNFLADSGSRPIWSAYSSGFALERDFERELQKRVYHRLKARSLSSDPIILHGQTGTGKSVALAALACRIRSEKQYAVVLIERRPLGPIAPDLDIFCKWADDAGFLGTVLIWDGMVHIDQYTALLKNLLGRGRNVVLVASTYKLEASESDRRSLVLAPSTLNTTEASRFKALLDRFEPTLGERLMEILKKDDATFLVALYRLLPETRSQVRYGLQRETSTAEISIKTTAENLEPEFAGGALAAAFQRSGVIGNISMLPGDSKLVGGEEFSATEELVGLIMVPGRFGLKVPVELVMRTIGRSRVSNFHKLFEKIDIFRWNSDNLGNIFIGARHPLEAKLICQARLGGPRLEVEFATRLLIEIDESEDRSENNQIQFAADLLRNLGPNGPEKRLYASFYEEIASCLARLRVERGVENPRIMLQEASLLREAVVAMHSTENRTEEKLALLSRAVETLKTALTNLAVDSRTRRLRAMLLVELASTFGTRVRELVRAQRSSQEVMANFDDAKRYAYQARILQPEDFFSIDVISWSTKDLITGSAIEDTSRLEVIVDLLSMFESCDQESMSLRDKEIFNRRRAEFGSLLKDERLQQDALTRLEQMGSKAGYYLKALMIAQEQTGHAALSVEGVRRISDAVDYLVDNYKIIESDGRCLFLLLRYWWVTKAHKPFFGGERQLLPFKVEDWKYLISLLDKLMSLDEIYRTPMNSYLRAVATWSLGYYQDAQEIWTELQRVSDSVTGRRRIAKSYVASNADGTPRFFNGTVDSVDLEETRGRVFVEGIREKVDFFPRDFGLSDLKRGQAVNSFCIAFNYIGPVAEPSHHAKS